jgi:serine protease Do
MLNRDHTIPAVRRPCIIHRPGRGSLLGARLLGARAALRCGAMALLILVLNVTVSTAQDSPMSVSPDGGTFVPIATELTSLLSEGGVPESLEQLQVLEGQQRKVATAPAACTVSVTIGSAQGCGVIVTESGFVLTAAHVAMRPKQLARITLSDGRVVRATTLGMNRNVDAGLIKIDPDQNGGRPWPHATLGTSNQLTTGMWCVATGHPGGYQPDRGTVTRIGRILSVRPGAIVTDCALIGGDSGGPLFDISGRLIAVHSRIGNDVADNLHVPIDNYDFSWKRLYNGEAWGFLPGFRPVLGVQGTPEGVAKIVTVAAGSPADDAGIKPDDVIEVFGKVSITDFSSLKAAVDDTMPGERVRILLNRNGDRLRCEVEIGRAE